MKSLLEFAERFHLNMKYSKRIHTIKFRVSVGYASYDYELVSILREIQKEMEGIGCCFDIISVDIRGIHERSSIKIKCYDDASRRIFMEFCVRAEDHIMNISF